MVRRWEGIHSARIEALEVMLEVAVEERRARISALIERMRGEVEARIRALTAMAEVRVEERRRRVELEIEEMQGELEAEIREMEKALEGRVKKLEERKDVVAGRYDARIERLSFALDDAAVTKEAVKRMIERRR